MASWQLSSRFNTFTEIRDIRQRLRVAREFNLPSIIYRARLGKNVVQQLGVSECVVLSPVHDDVGAERTNSVAFSLSFDFNQADVLLEEIAFYFGGCFGKVVK